MELIETLWNVNCHATSSAWEIALELIETLWNVNMTQQQWFALLR